MMDPFPHKRPSRASLRTECLYILAEYTAPHFSRQNIPDPDPAFQFIEKRPPCFLIPPCPPTSRLIFVPYTLNHKMATHDVRGTLGSILTGSGLAAMCVICLLFLPEVATGLIQKDGGLV